MKITSTLDNESLFYFCFVFRLYALEKIQMSFSLLIVPPPSLTIIGINRFETSYFLFVFVYLKFSIYLNLFSLKKIHTYIHTYFIGSSPRGFSESILHYKIINQVHDNKNITMIKEDKGQ